jgi:hypothetical protein
MSNRRKLKVPVTKRRRTDRELWEKACRAFPDEVENSVIALAEQEGVGWERIPLYGLQFWYQSVEQMERFQDQMAAIGQVLDPIA